MGSELIEAIRPFWLPGLVAVPGITVQGFTSLISRQQYQIRNAIGAGTATLFFSAPNEPVVALAYDLNRFASAAFETLAAVTRSSELPKSSAWLCIKAYYGAYYAGNALVRSLGRTYSRLDTNSVNALNAIIDLFQMSNGIVLPVATYSGHLDTSSSAFEINRAPDAQGGASHSGFWRFFLDEVRSLRNRILKGAGLTSQNQRAALKLDELCGALCSDGHGHGGWLSAVRNEINYRHLRGCWYPYDYRRQFADQLYSLVPRWRQDPYSLDLGPHGPPDLTRFLTTCVFLIALCRELVESIVDRRSVRQVFVEGGCVRLLSLAF